MWLGAPLLLGMVLGATLARGWPSVYGLLAVGILIGFFVLLVFYLNAPADYAHSGGDEDGGMYFGRWWELPFDVFVVAIAYLCYLVGVGIGAFVRAVVREIRPSS